MDKAFWHGRWEQGKIAFHENVVNPLLVKHFDELSLARRGRVFLPLCGKTLDIGWLLARGYAVVGVELSNIAIEQLFAELKVDPAISQAGRLKHYRSLNLDVLVGDFFDLSREQLGRVDAIYDRAALVALPEATRPRYAAHLMEITGKAQQLLISYEYDRSAMEGPPFSISNQEVERHYGANFVLTLLASADVRGGLKGMCAAKESVWRLASASSTRASTSPASIRTT
jgi:thiopurine S-methyltransferase